jgi:hypothetical protein
LAEPFPELHPTYGKVAKEYSVRRLPHDAGEVTPADSLPAREGGSPFGR